MGSAEGKVIVHSFSLYPAQLFLIVSRQSQWIFTKVNLGNNSNINTQLKWTKIFDCSEKSVLTLPGIFFIHFNSALCSAVCKLFLPPWFSTFALQSLWKTFAAFLWFGNGFVLCLPRINFIEVFFSTRNRFTKTKTKWIELSFFDCV